MGTYCRKNVTAIMMVGFIGIMATLSAQSQWDVANSVVYPSNKTDMRKSETINNTVLRGSRAYKKWSSISASDFDNKNYKDSIVMHGAYLGRDLHWKAKWWVGAKDEPGELLDSGGTSGWKLLNTLDPTSNAQWEGGDKSPSSSAIVTLPTWQDGAKGAYALISDDFGAFNGNEGFHQIWEIAEDVARPEYAYFNNYNPIRMGFGIQVDKSDESEYADMRDNILKRGHEILCHSYDHTSASHQWLWFYQNDTTGVAAEEINGFTQAGGDTIPMSGVCVGLDDPYVKDLAYVNNLKHVGKDLPKWASGAIVVNSEFDNKPGAITNYGAYEVKDASDGSVRWIKTNAKSWIKDAEVFVCILDCSERANTDEGDDLTNKYNGWSGNEWNLNIRKAKDTLEMNTYDKLKASGDIPSKYWAKDKCVDFYIYPYDAFSKTTHDSLKAAGYVGARGGSKSATPTPLDFFHPFRTDFDAHFSDAMGTYPDNPHQYLTLQSMLDSIVSTHGFHTREFHTVTNDPALGWGSIPEQNFRDHLTDVLSRIKNGDITMLTPTDAVKYRITTDNMSVSIEDGSNNNTWVVTPNVTLDAQYHDTYNGILVSYIVTLPVGFTPESGCTMKAKYVGSGKMVRRMPRILQRRGVENSWAVYADPYKGAVEIYFDNTSINESKKAFVAKNRSFTFNHILNGKLSFSAIAGNYKIQLFSANGKLVRSINQDLAKSGIVTNNINTNNLTKGYYILKLTNNGMTIKKSIILK